MKEVFILKNVSAEHVDIIGVFATRESAEKCIISKGFTRSGNYYRNPAMLYSPTSFADRVVWIQRYPVISEGCEEDK